MYKFLFERDAGSYGYYYEIVAIDIESMTMNFFDTNVDMKYIGKVFNSKKYINAGISGRYTINKDLYITNHNIYNTAEILFQSFDLDEVKSFIKQYKMTEYL